MASIKQKKTKTRAQTTATEKLEKDLTDEKASQTKEKEKPDTEVWALPRKAAKWLLHVAASARRSAAEVCS
jgi:predicted RNA-binding Zn ribbon-like protein